MPAQQSASSMADWNPPQVRPTAVGEYRAALEPLEAAPSSRRWWNGRWWSNPYHAHYEPEVIERIRQEPSVFSPFWQTLPH